jgi:hypothetical protein
MVILPARSKPTRGARQAAGPGSGDAAGKN